MAKETKNEAMKKNQKEFVEMKKSATKELKEFAKRQEFPFESETDVNDLNGEPTRVLIVDVDKKGVLGMYMEHGQPYSFDTTGVISEDKTIMAHYLKFMMNVDINDDDVLQAVGWDSLTKARDMVKGFFMLRLVSQVSVAPVTAK